MLILSDSVILNFLMKHSRSSSLKLLYSSQLHGTWSDWWTFFRVHTQEKTWARTVCASHVHRLIRDRWLWSNNEKAGQSTSVNAAPAAALLTFRWRSLRTDEPDKGQRGGKCGSSTFQERRRNWQMDGLIDVGGERECESSCRMPLRGAADTKWIMGITSKHPSRAAKL